MTALRVMFVGQGPSGLAEDKVVNTFHFEGAGVFDPGDMAVCLDLVEDLYTGVGVAPNVQDYALGAYLSPWVERSAMLLGYNLADAKPRTPSPQPFTLPAARATSGLPEEVAACITLHGAPPLTARRRGRIYIGPLCISAYTAAVAGAGSYVNPFFINDALKAVERLARDVTSTLNWSIRSTLPSENFVPIVSGYMDDAFDTQRRRGASPTRRQVFTTSS